MTTIDLAELLMKKMGWGYEDIAQRCGLKRQSVYENIQRTKSGASQRGTFPLNILRLAFENGLQTEAFTVLFREETTPEITTLIRAAILYPDLSPDELAKLRTAEEVTSMSSLPKEVIESIIEKSRS